MAPLIALALKLLPFAGAVPEVARALGGDQAGMAAEKVVSIAKAVSGHAEPDKAVEAVIADPALQLELQKTLSAERLEFARLELRREELYVEDTNRARLAHAADRRVFWLGVAVLLTFLLDIGATFWLAYAILTGGLTVKDVGLVAAVFGMLGTLNGYVAANAQQVLAYYFGSSKGSQDKTNAMSAAVSKLGAR